MMTRVYCNVSRGPMKVTRNPKTGMVDKVEPGDLIPDTRIATFTNSGKGIQRCSRCGGTQPHETR